MSEENNPAPTKSSAEVAEHHRAYWRSNIRLVLILLAVWFLFGCVLSILLVDKLNEFSIGGFPLGFWISQQGTIVAFIVLVFIYAKQLQKLDREHGVEDEGVDELPKEH